MRGAFAWPRAFAVGTRPTLGRGSGRQRLATTVWLRCSTRDHAQIGIPYPTAPARRFAYLRCFERVFVYLRLCGTAVSARCGRDMRGAPTR
jgi:hypothetical protein